MPGIPPLPLDYHTVMRGLISFLPLCKNSPISLTKMCSKILLFSRTHSFIKDYVIKDFQRANSLHGFSFHTKVFEMLTGKVMQGHYHMTFPAVGQGHIDQ